MRIDRTNNSSRPRPKESDRCEPVASFHASSGHTEALDSTLLRAWELTGAGAPDFSAMPEGPSAEAIIHAAKARPTAHTFPRAGRWRDRVRWGLQAAAMLVLGLGIGRFWLGEVPGQPGTGAMEVRTRLGEMATVRLDDGSVVRLAPESRLRFTGGQDLQKVELDGQAFFVVAPQGERVFSVTTRLGETHVLGTRFEVRARDDSLRVVVVEGRVAVAVGEDEFEVGDGQMMLTAANTKPAVVSVDNVSPLLGWMDSWLVFQRTPLAQVAKDVSQRYGRHVDVIDQELARRTITASFGDEPFEDVVTVICRIVQATCMLEDSIVTISR